MKLSDLEWHTHNDVTWCNFPGGTIWKRADGTYTISSDRYLGNLDPLSAQCELIEAQERQRKRRK